MVVVGVYKSWNEALRVILRKIRTMVTWLGHLSLGGPTLTGPVTTDGLTTLDGGHVITDPVIPPPSG